MIESILQVAGTAYAVSAVVFLLACARFVLRRLKNERIYPDDWLMVVAWFILLGNVSKFPVLLYTRNGPNPNSDNETASGSVFDKKYVFLSRFTYLSYIWALKACILIYYYRLTARQPEQRHVIRTSWGIACTWTATMLLWMLQCRPFILNWQLSPVPACANGRPGLVFMAISIIVTNIILIILPLPMIWRTQMSIGTKLKVSAVFLVGIFLVVISILRAMMQEGLSHDPNDKFFWGELECLGMALFANTPIINALYRRCKNGPASNHLASRSPIRSARNTDNIELCSGEVCREVDFMEALRASGPESMKEPDSELITPLQPAKIAPSSPSLRDPNRKAIPNTNLLLSVSKSRGAICDPLHYTQTIEVIQTSEPADPNNPMMPNPLGGIGRVETRVYHHDNSPLPSNPNLLDELYSSHHRSMNFEDMLAHGPPRRA